MKKEVNRIWRQLNELHRDGREVGGNQPVSNWDISTLVEEVVEKDVSETDFQSQGEMINFVLGNENYSDTNSFVYTEDDLEQIKSEGFFQKPYCPECLRDVTDMDVHEPKIDPEIEPEVLEYTEKSFMHGSSAKEVKEVWYQCEEHPDFYIKSESQEHL